MEILRTSFHRAARFLSASFCFLFFGFPTANAQSISDLTEKLVKKGIITQEDAQAIRASPNAAPEFLQTTPTTAALKFSGDFRPRFEQHTADSPQFFERDRLRFRLRVGMTFELPEHFEAGFRIATGNPARTPAGVVLAGSPSTANQDLNSLQARRFLWIDTAYAKWSRASEPWAFSAVIGKFDNPFQLSNMFWDYDIAPEGAAFVASYANGGHSFKLISAFIPLDEFNQTPSTLPSVNPAHDPFLYGAQLIWDAKWSPAWETSVGAAAFDFAHEENVIASLEPFNNAGSTRDPANSALRNNLNPLVATASATYWLTEFPAYPGKFPVRAMGEYLWNPAISSNNSAFRAGVTFGKSGRKHAWEISYRYQRLEADAWFDQLVDDGNGAFYATGNPQLAGTGRASGYFGGTNVKGHLIGGAYSITDTFNCSVVYYLNDLIINAPGQSSHGGHFIADLIFRF